MVKLVSRESIEGNKYAYAICYVSYLLMKSEKIERFFLDEIRPLNLLKYVVYEVKEGRKKQFNESYARIFKKFGLDVKVIDMRVSISSSNMEHHWEVEKFFHKDKDLLKQMHDEFAEPYGCWDENWFTQEIRQLFKDRNPKGVVMETPTKRIDETGTHFYGEKAVDSKSNDESGFDFERSVNHINKVADNVLGDDKDFYMDEAVDLIRSVEDGIKDSSSDLFSKIKSVESKNN